MITCKSKLMKIYIAILLLAFSGSAFADSYLCVAEVGAGIVEEESKIRAKVFDVSDAKWIITNESGKWVVKQLGQEFANFDICDSHFHCEASTGWAGYFRFYSKALKFEAVTFGLVNDNASRALQMGSCSKI